MAAQHHPNIPVNGPPVGDDCPPTPGQLTQQAERCRRLAGATYDREVCKALGKLAEEFDRTADELARRNGQVSE
jgi:hypothetical protein